MVVYDTEIIHHTVFIELYEKLPKEIIQLGKRAVHFYVQSLTKGEYVNNLVRTMFVGHFGVGKRL